MVKEVILRCAWCKKPIENSDFSIQLTFMTPNEEIKRSILAGLFEAPKQLIVEEKAIKVLYQFCGRAHKDEYKRFLQSEGVKVY